MNTKRFLLTIAIMIFLCVGFQNCGPSGGFSSLNTGSLDEGSSSPPPAPLADTTPLPTSTAAPSPTIVPNAKYVSTSGNNANDGSAQSPWKTISYGVSKLSSGDTLYVMTGTYAETVNIGQNNITLSAYPNNKPVIDGGSALPSSDWSSLVSVAGNNNLTCIST